MSVVAESWVCNARSMGGGLGADDIVEDAIAATGISDVGDDWFMTPLAAWASDLEQPNLTDRGRRFLRSLAVRDVSRRLRVLATLREHPEINDVEIPPIVYITGLERSGTTVLHNLVALHRSSRALRRWELMEPIPPPTTATYETDPRIAAVQASVEPLRGSLLEQMHWVNADEPEECVWGFVDCVSMLGQAPSMCMPNWGRFISEADQTPAFEHYRQVVQLLTWRHPVDPGGFLVLKAPQIARHLDAFADVFPEARFVVTDRDPFRALVSVAVLGQSIVEPFSVVDRRDRTARRDRCAGRSGSRRSDRGLPRRSARRSTELASATPRHVRLRPRSGSRAACHRPVLRPVRYRPRTPASHRRRLTSLVGKASLGRRRS